MNIKHFTIALLCLMAQSTYAQTVPSGKTLNQLPAATTPNGAELVYCLQGSLDRKCTVTQINQSRQPAAANLDAYATKTPPTGTVVGTTDTQTLTGKTIDGNTNTVTNIPIGNTTGNLPVSRLNGGLSADATTCWRGDGTWGACGSGGSGGGAPTNATYVTQTANSTLTNEFALSNLATGFVWVTNGTGGLTTASQANLFGVMGAGTTAGQMICTNGTAAYWCSGSNLPDLTAPTAVLQTDLLMAHSMTDGRAAKWTMLNLRAALLGSFTGCSSGSPVLTFTGVCASGGGGSGSGDVTSIVSSSTDNQLVLFNSTTGKVIKPSTSTYGPVKLVAGVPNSMTQAEILSAITTSTPANGTVLTMVSGAATWSAGTAPNALPAATNTNVADVLIGWSVTDSAASKFTYTQLKNAINGGVSTLTTSTTFLPNCAGEQTNMNMTGATGTISVSTPTGCTPADGQKLVLRIQVTNVQSLTFSGGYRAGTTALPTTLAATKTEYLGFRYNAASSTYDFMASAGGF